MMLAVMYCLRLFALVDVCCHGDGGGPVTKYQGHVHKLMPIGNSCCTVAMAMVVMGYMCVMAIHTLIHYYVDIGYFLSNGDGSGMTDSHALDCILSCLPVAQSGTFSTQLNGENLFTA